MRSTEKQDHAKLPRVLIFGHREFSHLVGSVLSEFDGRAHFQIIDSIFGQLTSLEEQIAEYRPDVIVSAGSNAAYLKSVLSLPVVSLEITESDIVAAISKAAKLCDKLVMISFDPPPKILTHLQDMLDVKVVHKRYTTIDEAREQLYLSMSEQFEVVVSASFICGIAEQNGIRSILFYSKESCRKMLETALLAGRNYRSRVLDRSLNNLIFGEYQSPVILADNEGKVLRINRVARQEFQLDSNTDRSSRSSVRLMCCKGSRGSARLAEVPGATCIVNWKSERTLPDTCSISIVLPG
jgi:propionate catabolism operon transcriptional regulator